LTIVLEARLHHVELDARPREHRLLAIDLAFPVEDGEEIAEVAESLGGAEEEITLGTERVVEDRDDLPLQRRAEVDHHVAAADQIEFRKRRILRHVLPSEDAAIADRLADAIAAIHLAEETAEPLGRHFADDILGIKARSRPLDCPFTDVGSEDL